MEQDHNVQALISAMREKAESEKSEILAEAQAKAGKILARGDAEIAGLKAEAEKQLEYEVVDEKGKLLGHVRLKKRERLLAVKERALKEAFGRARDKLLDLCGGDDYESAVKMLISEAIEENGNCGEISVASEDEALCRSRLAEMGHSCTVKASGPGPGVVVARSRDGRKTVDNSILIRLTKVEAGMIHEVAGILFGGDQTVKSS